MAGIRWAEAAARSTSSWGSNESTSGTSSWQWVAIPAEFIADQPSALVDRIVEANPAPRTELGGKSSSWEPEYTICHVVWDSRYIYIYISFLYIYIYTNKQPIMALKEDQIPLSRNVRGLCCQGKPLLEYLEASQCPTAPMSLMSKRST